VLEVAVGREETSMNIRLLFTELIAYAALSAAVDANAGVILVTNLESGTVGAYTTSGATINPALISGLKFADAVAVSNGHVFVADGIGTIGEYTTSGATINASLITGLGPTASVAVSGGYLFVGHNGGIGKYTTSGETVNASLVSGGIYARDIAISGNKLFIADSANGVVGEYTTSGVTVNPAFIRMPGIDEALDIAVSGNKLFVGVQGPASGRVSEYTISGTTVDASLISGVLAPEGVAVSGDKLFVAYGAHFGRIGEYTISGDTVNASLVRGLGFPSDIAVISSSVPDGSSTWSLLLIGLAVMSGLKLLLPRESGTIVRQCAD
jgi:hypothetical protein